MGSWLPRISAKTASVSNSVGPTVTIECPQQPWRVSFTALHHVPKKVHALFMLLLSQPGALCLMDSFSFFLESDYHRSIDCERWTGESENCLLFLVVDNSLKGTT